MRRINVSIIGKFALKGMTSNDTIISLQWENDKVKMKMTR